MSAQLTQQGMEQFAQELIELTQKYNFASVVGCVISAGIVAPFSIRPKNNPILEGDEIKRIHLHGRLIEICSREMHGVGLTGAKVRDFNIKM